MFKTVHVRSSRQHSKYMAFTLVELLIVIAVIGLLIALLLPAIMSARGASRRVQCLSRMRQIGLAKNLFEGARGHYPGWAMPHKNPHDDYVISWFSSILGHLDEGEITDHWGRLSIIGFAICPDDAEFQQHLIIEGKEGINYSTSYVANAGIYDGDLQYGRRYMDPPVRALDSRANGICHELAVPMHWQRPWLRVSADYIARKDGTAHTVLLSENVDAISWLPAIEVHNCFLWNVDEQTCINEKRGERPPGKKIVKNTNPTNETSAQNTLHRRYARPSSYHQGGGVNMVFCDGHGRFVSEDIEYWMYVQFMTPYGDRALSNVTNRTPVPSEFRQRLRGD